MGVPGASTELAGHLMTRFALYEHPHGVETHSGCCVVYDLGRGNAHFGSVRIEGPALVWELFADPEREARLAARVDLGEDPGEWVLRCDRVDFPPGGIAYRHVHPGPGIRRLLRGELTIDSPDGIHTHRAGDSWHEGADHPVLATASATDDTAFVRVMLLPAEWAGKRTIRYLDPADEAKPKLQRATILLEHAVEP